MWEASRLLPVLLTPPPYRSGLVLFTPHVHAGEALKTPASPTFLINYTKTIKVLVKILNLSPSHIQYC